MRLLHTGPIARGTLATLGVHVVRFAFQITLLFLLARFLGPGNLGEFAAIAALALSLGAFSSFGLGFVVLSESAVSSQRGKEVMTRAIAATLISACLLLPAFLEISRALLNSSASPLVLVLVGLTELLLMPLLGLLGYRLQGLGCIVQSQSVLIVPLLLRLGGLALCLVMVVRGTLEAFAWIIFGATLIGLLVSWGFSWRRASLPTRLAWPTISELFRGTRYAVMRFTAVSPSEVDKAMAFRLFVSTDAGLYAFAARGLAVATMPVAAMVISAQPRLIREAVLGDGNSRQLIILVIGLALLYGVTAGLGIALIAAPVVQWILGNEFSGINSILKQLAWVAPFMAVRFAGGGIFISLNRPLHRSAIELAGLVTLLVLGFYFGRSYGVSGLILAVVVSELGMAILFSIYLWMSVSKRRGLGGKNVAK